MDFSDALKAMKEGKKVRRPAHGGSFCYITHPKDSEPIIWKSDCGEKKLYSQEVLADDWEIIEDIQEVETYTKRFVKCPKCNEEVESGIFNNIFCSSCGQEIKPKLVQKDKYMISFPDLSKLKTPEDAENLVKSLFGENETIQGMAHGEVLIKIPNHYTRVIEF